MKGRNIIVLGSTLLIATILLIIAYAQPVTYPIFWGKVTVDGLPAFDATVKAYVEVTPGNYEYREQTTAVESNGEAWYSFNIPGTADDEGNTIRLNVTPSGGGSDSYLGGTDTYNSGDSTLLHLYASTASPPTGCNLGASCDGCTGWVSVDTSHASCNSPYNGCVRKNGGANYEWSCCGGTITQISIF